ncbi:hypothetical protein [Comamonas avium]|uniref:Uncharacterized protein n=1 Tax=Comamonas avium TaxID=2762231 RepID=A0ABR8S713_9BURK|nr:hypothetical protein [Comamonas avium]MBD7959276.1 hypothetical protein [Comamonas avium]
MNSESFKEYNAWPVEFQNLKKITKKEIEEKIKSHTFIFKNFFIDELISIESQEINSHLIFENCFFPKRFEINQSSFKNSLQFKSCRILDLVIRNSKFHGAIFLKNNLIGNFELKRIETKNQINIIDNTFTKKNKILYFTDIKSNDTINIKDSSFQSGISFQHSSFKALVFESVTINSEDKFSINLNGTQCKSFINVKKSTISSQIQLINSNIEDSFFIEKCKIHSLRKSESALTIQRSKICNFIFHKNNIYGSINLSSNSFSRILDLQNSYILNDGRLEIFDCQVNSPSVLNSLHLTGGLLIASSKFQDILKIKDISHSSALNKKNEEYLIEISHSEFQKNLTIELISSKNPSISFTNSNFHKDLILEKINYFSSKKSIAIIDCDISNRLILSTVNEISNCIFKNSYCKILEDEITSWKCNNIFINFNYCLISENSIIDLKERVKWIKNISHTRKNHDDCYAILLKSYKEMNLQHQFKELSFNISDHKREISTGYNRLILSAYKNLIGYGYKPNLLINYILFFIFFGSLIYYFAAERSIITPNQAIVYTDNDIKICSKENWIYCKELPNEYPSFNPLIYSIDTMLPFVDLGQEKSWSIKTNSNKKDFYESISTMEIGNIIRWFQWIQILFGWLSSLIIIAWFSGFIKIDKNN